MRKNHGLLALLTIALLMAAGGAMAPRTAPPASAGEAMTTPAPSPSGVSPEVSCDQGPSDGEDRSPASVPGCCTTQCNVDKDCDKICGKGNCACLQQTPCCRRCVY